MIKQNIRMGRAKIKAIKGLLECMHDVSYKQNISKSYKQSLINFGELGRDGRVTNRWHILGNPDSHSGFFNPDQGAEFFNWSAQIYDVNNMTNSGEQLGRDFITVCVCVLVGACVDPQVPRGGNVTVLLTSASPRAWLPLTTSVSAAAAGRACHCDAEPAWPAEDVTHTA